ncbi:MAG: hypothetical protein Q8M29_11720 [Bacteroidota bacterium]|nr:hypothetical protein [Bacteroidota bacterium]
MKLTFTLLLILAFTIPAKSQNEFAQGYIIGPKNDTIKGEVKLFTKNEMDYYVKMFFRNKPVGNGKQYLPAKIHGYGVEERHYASIKYFDIWVFMQIICKGKIMFYEYKPPVSMGNEKMESMYFAMKGGENEMVQIFPNSKVKKQLKPFISDDKELTKEMEGLEMHYNEIVDFISRYNERNP